MNTQRKEWKAEKENFFSRQICFEKRQRKKKEGKNKKRREEGGWKYHKMLWPMEGEREAHFKCQLEYMSSVKSCLGFFSQSFSKKVVYHSLHRNYIHRTRSIVSSFFQSSVWSFMFATFYDDAIRIVEKIIEFWQKVPER